MFDLVGNPEYRFKRDGAHMSHVLVTPIVSYFSKSKAQISSLLSLDSKSNSKPSDCTFICGKGLV